MSIYCVKPGERSPEQAESEKLTFDWWQPCWGELLKMTTSELGDSVPSQKCFCGMPPRLGFPTWKVSAALHTQSSRSKMAAQNVNSSKTVNDLLLLCVCDSLNKLYRELRAGCPWMCCRSVCINKNCSALPVIPEWLYLAKIQKKSCLIHFLLIPGSLESTESVGKCCCIWAWTLKRQLML